MHRTGKFPSGRTTGQDKIEPDTDRAGYRFQNWAMYDGKQSKRLLQKRGKHLFYFFFNIKIPETFGCCREMNVQKWQ